jgi:archaellum component FlaD/FlaE
MFKAWLARRRQRKLERQMQMAALQQQRQQLPPLPPSPQPPSPPTTGKPLAQIKPAKRPSAPLPPLPRRSYELRVGTPDVSGREAEFREVAVVERGDAALKTITIKPPKRKISAKLKDKYVDARITKVEHAINKVNDRVTQLDELTERMRSDIDEIKESVSRMEVTMNELETMREGYANVEKTVRELSALYDLVSAQINPFIEVKGLPTSQPSVTQQPLQEPEGSLPATIDEENPFIDMPKAFPAEAPSTKPAEEEKTDLSTDLWILKWTQFLLERVPQESIPNLMEYYRNLGWIDEEVEAKVKTYLEGAKPVAPPIEAIETAGDMLITADGKAMGLDQWKLTIEDHTKSLEFIEKLMKRPIKSKRQSTQTTATTTT